MDSIFANVPRTPGEHFKLYFFAAVLNVLTRLVQEYGGFEQLFEQFPFLVGYHNEIAAWGLEGCTLQEGRARWEAELADWESSAPQLPLCRLQRMTGLERTTLTLLLSIGLADQDPRFGALVETIQNTPGHPRASLGLLAAWWNDLEKDAFADVRQLQEFGLVRVLNQDAPRSAWAPSIPGALWNALRGERYSSPAPWLRYLPPDALISAQDLIVDDATRQLALRLPQLLDDDHPHVLVVRGPQHNGRHTLIGSVARSMGQGLLAPDDARRLDAEQTALIAPLAILLDAAPVLTLDLAPGETFEFKPLNGYVGLVGIVMGKQGGLSGEGAANATTITLASSDPDARAQHWQAALGDAASTAECVTLAQQFRMTGGNIRRTALLARSQAALNGRKHIARDDVRQARRALHHQLLEPLAMYVPPLPVVSPEEAWRQLALSVQVADELAMLQVRCLHREKLSFALGGGLAAQLNPGVRALFSGPSGTGKTLAARALAAALGMDLYRLDLATVVNKYIGETEKNLNQIFSRAEESDVILLLDEGDALMTQRTNVQSSNDRYANLETNFLLQRVESYEGILLVTSNASNRIDGAFQRRMDVVVNFHAPDIVERRVIWKLHLPAQHLIDDALLEQVAQRCALTGGQIRNAALHASLLALNNGGVIQSEYLVNAVEREYRKTGAVCPLRAKAAHG